MILRMIVKRLEVSGLWSILVFFLPVFSFVLINFLVSMSLSFSRFFWSFNFFGFSIFSYLLILSFFRLRVSFYLWISCQSFCFIHENRSGYAYEYSTMIRLLCFDDACYGCLDVCIQKKPSLIIFIKLPLEVRTAGSDGFLLTF